MNYKVFKIICLVALGLSLNNCAKRGRPTGGLKDSIAPILVSASPNYNSINFTAKKIKIYFDEYIKLKDVNKQLIISPPQNNNPIITPLGTASKLITIKILDTLDANTTYVFNFGNSIVDNNEENELGNFKYVFSTGGYIDSLNLAGEVTNPLKKETEKNINVMLYEYNDSFTDSIIFKEKPRYIANTLDSTLFELTNLRAGKYLLIALKDANGNKIYNPKIDEIGFVKDTITIPTDKKYNFTIFKEIPVLKIIKPKEVAKGHLIFGFEGNAKDLTINLLTQTPNSFNSKIIFEKNKDTINYWYTPFEVDSLNFLVSKGEYSEKFVIKTRTSKIDSLEITKSTKSILHLLDTFSISTNIPIVNFNKSLVKILEKDSINVAFNATVLKTKIYLDFEKKYNTTYNFKLLPKAITDIFGASNDSLFFKLKTKLPEDYGVLNLELLSSKKTPLIVELLTDKGELVRLKKLNTPKKVSFNLLPPNQYLIRVTLDENNNGIWDTGNFLDKKQPEVIKYFENVITIRANWEGNEVFNLD
ncbi:Ig-like domain-containing protein [Lutibacter sp.]